MLGALELVRDQREASGSAREGTRPRAGRAPCGRCSRPGTSEPSCRTRGGGSCPRGPCRSRSRAPAARPGCARAPGAPASATSSGDSTCSVWWSITPIPIFLSVIARADRLEVQRARARRLERDHVGVDLVEQLERRRCRSDLREHALLRRVAPAGVAPDLGLRAQSPDRVVEDLEHELGVDHRRRRCRAPRAGGSAAPPSGSPGSPASARSCSSSLSASLIAMIRSGVLVVLVLHGEGDQLRRDGAELDRLLSSAAARPSSISAYCSSPRPTGPTIFGITRASR